MPPIGTEQVIQGATSVERVQEAMQQQMELRQRLLRSRQEKEDEAKTRSVNRAEPQDQITIHADREQEQGTRDGGTQPDDEEEVKEGGEEAAPAAKAPTPAAPGEPAPTPRVNIVI